MVTPVAITLVVLSVVGAGVALADTGGITGIGVVDAEDRDCDGASSAFSLRVEADTECVGCNDESANSPDIEPYVHVDVTGRAASMDTLRVGQLPNTRSYSAVYQLSRRMEITERGVVDVEVELVDADPLLSDVVDSAQVAVEVEPRGADPVSRPQARVTASTPTPTVDLWDAGEDLLPGETVQFDAARSTTGGCELVAYQWDFDGDGRPDARGQQVGFTPSAAGTTTVTLTVVDETGQRDTARWQTTVVADTDGDGIADAREREIGSNPRRTDTDGDVVTDRLDPFPATMLLPLGPPVLLVFGVVAVVAWWKGPRSRSSSTPSPSPSSGGETDTNVYTPGQGRGPDTDTRVWSPGDATATAERETRASGGRGVSARCPECDGRLPGRGADRFCPRCGTKL